MGFVLRSIYVRNERMSGEGLDEDTYFDSCGGRMTNGGS